MERGDRRVVAAARRCSPLGGRPACGQPDALFLLPFEIAA